MSDFDVNYNNNDSYTMEDFENNDHYVNEEFSDYPDEIVDLDDEETVNTSETFSVVGKKKKKTKKKKVDKGYRKFKTKDGNVVYFATSMLPGNSIRDAIYGNHFHEHVVGTWHEELFFKVSKTDNCSTQHVDTLFYNNPEQFESHMNVIVDSETKNAWAERYQYALQYFTKEKQQQEQAEKKYTTIK